MASVDGVQHMLFTNTYSIHTLYKTRLHVHVKISGENAELAVELVYFEWRSYTVDTPKTNSGSTYKSFHATYTYAYPL